jgi:plasmid stabilization system protein ParE
MKLIISTAARADLAAIEDYIAADNPTRAASFVDELVNRCEDLTTQPKRFPLVAPFRRAGIRRRPYKDYLKTEDNYSAYVPDLQLPFCSFDEF